PENFIVMETGGMKGRGKEMVREELHQILCKRFSINSVHSEYGMTEMLSQAYAKKHGIYHSPPWLRVQIRDVNDPFQLSGYNKTGGINIIDLANVYSCPFIETQDLGRKYENGTFEVVGRFDRSKTRGCNLMIP
ncbi:MAG: acyltransferase, partial [Bacteroidales bacterium]|nr:acyltransferase [Bacteroidales bacterium]